MSLPAVIEPIPPVDFRRLDRMPQLPGWLASRVASMSDVVQHDPATDWHRLMPTLPANSTLTEGERAMIEEHISMLEEHCARTPENSADAEGDLVLMLTEMLLAKPSATQSEASAEARGKTYLIALDDMPVWSVQNAIRLWYRGQAGEDVRGQPYDYRWAPDSAALRRIAMFERYRVTSRIETLRKLLSAVPLIEFSEEHCHEMRQRLSKLMHDTFGIPLVGKDGSGGTVDVKPAAGAHCGTEPKHTPA